MEEGALRNRKRYILCYGRPFPTSWQVKEDVALAYLTSSGGKGEYKL